MSFLVKWRVCRVREGWLPCFLIWLLVCVVSGLVVGLLGKKGLAALLSDVAPSGCTFWFSGGLAWEERAACLAF